MEQKRWLMNEYPNDLTWSRAKLDAVIVQREGEKEQIFHAPESMKAGAGKVYVGIFQMLVSKGIMDCNWLIDVCRKEHYAFNEAEHEEKLQRSRDENSEKRYQNLKDKDFPDLPDLYFFVSVNSDVKKYKTQTLPVYMHEIIRVFLQEKGNKGLKLSVLYSLKEKTVKNSVADTEEELDDGEVPLEEQKTGVAVNTILYGPPGTGKTYNTRYYAVAIAEKETLHETKERYASYGELTSVYKTLQENGRVQMVTFHQSYGYEEFIQGIRPLMKKDGEEQGQEIGYKVEDGVFTAFCKKAAEDRGNNYIFIIDEINRGNVAKIFGELITLIEPSKREGAEEEIKIKLPYTAADDETRFAVPPNVFLLGTMNTADRSLTLLDTALRRRFEFVEMLPEPALLKDVVVDGISVQELLENINGKLELLLDREHTIGHAFFMDLKEKPSMQLLGRIMRYKVIPLLQEFFYDDYGMLQVILGKKIIAAKRADKLRKELERKLAGRQLPPQYEIKWDALETKEAYEELLSRAEQADETTPSDGEGESV